MRDKNKVYLLSLVAIFIIGIFLIYGLNSSNFTYNLGSRIPKIISMIITGGAIAFSTVVFQTVTNNRVITPSILGLDALYGFLQTVGVFIFGASSIMMTNKNLNFIISTVFMIISTLLLYKYLFKDSKSNIYFLLLIGTVFGTFFRSMSTFMQVLTDPNDFEVLQNKLFASFNNINGDVLLLAIIIVMIIFAFIFDDIKKLDILHLGRDGAINLGVDYDKFSKKMMIVVAILVSVATALVGPVTFLGLLVANLAYNFIKTYKHSYIIIISMLISIIALVGGQFVVEQLLNYSSTVSIIINFIGGIYFIFLLLKGEKI